MLALSIEVTESAAPVGVGLRILAGAILGLMVLRASTVERLRSAARGVQNGLLCGG